MPPLPPVADVVKYTQSWHISTNIKAESILHFSYTGSAPDGSACAALAADIQAAAVSEFKSLMNTSAFVGPGTILDLATNTGASGSGGTTTVGTRTGAGNPASTCVVMLHSIARRYRGGKPRTYLPFGVVGDFATQGTWDSTLLTAVASAWSSFITTAIAASSGGCDLSEFVNVSYVTGGAPRTTPHVDTISASVPRIPIGTQRRRLKGA